METNYIGLNVGGKIYQTSSTTLTRDPNCFFALMLSDRIPTTKDKHGNYVIDRDGEIFRHVLNFMRCGKLVLPDDFKEISLFECEADFFQLDSLRSQIKSSLPRNVGLNVNGDVFWMTKKSLTREPESFFSAVLRGEVLAPTDEHGNYWIKRNDVSAYRVIPHIFNYLHSGEVFKTLIAARDLEEFDLLKKEVDRFQLKYLKKYIHSIESFRKKSAEQSQLHVELYCFRDGTFMLTIHSNASIYGKSFLPLVSDDFKTIGYGVKAVSFELDASLEETEETVVIGRSTSASAKSSKVFRYPTSEEELKSYLSERMHANIVETMQLTAECSKVEYLRVLPEVPCEWRRFPTYQRSICL